MPGRIIGCFCCLLCALPFLYLAWEGKQKSAAPLAFRSGDGTFKDKTKHIPGKYAAPHLTTNRRETPCA